MFTHAAGALGGAYKAAANDDLVIAVQIEHPNAVKEIEEILAEGVDVVFVRLSSLPVAYVVGLTTWDLV